MRPRAPTTRIALLASLIALPASALAQDAPKETRTFPTLARAINARLEDPRLGSTRVGVHAVDLDTGDVLYARDAEGAYNPASNVKLFTAACGLDTFGPAHQFRTDVFAEGLSADGTAVEGNLTVRGEGSSYLFYKHTLEWAAALKNRGIT
ncbi:MAG: D-alanyl-D-alanine carboxypeptidase, partial [Myxococcota bacterium]